MKKNDLYNKTLEELYYIYKDNNKKIDRNALVLFGGTIGSIPGLYFDLDLTKSVLVLFLYCLAGKSIKDIISDIKFLSNYGMYYRNSKEYLDTYKNYKIILEEISKLCKDLNWDNEMKIFSGYSYLLKQG